MRIDKAAMTSAVQWMQQLFEMAWRRLTSKCGASDDDKEFVRSLAEPVNREMNRILLSSKAALTAFDPEFIFQFSDMGTIVEAIFWHHTYHTKNLSDVEKKKQSGHSISQAHDFTNSKQSH